MGNDAPGRDNAAVADIFKVTLAVSHHQQDRRKEPRVVAVPCAWLKTL